MQGIKSVKVRGKPEAADRLKINYQGERIPVANMSFELMPQFENGRLKQVVLMSDAQCGENAMATFATLSAALAAKYPERVVSLEGMQRSDIARANLRSTQTGEPDEVRLNCPCRTELRHPAIGREIDSVAIAFERPLAIEQVEHRKRPSSVIVIWRKPDADTRIGIVVESDRIDDFDPVSGIDTLRESS